MQIFVKENLSKQTTFVGNIALLLACEYGKAVATRTSPRVFLTSPKKIIY